MECPNCGNKKYVVEPVAYCRGDCDHKWGLEYLEPGEQILTPIMYAAVKATIDCKRCKTCKTLLSIAFANVLENK